MNTYIQPEEIQHQNLGNFDFDHLHATLDEHDTETPIFIHVGGVSAVGKTTLSLILVN